MIDITTETKNALHQPVKQVRARITWNDGDGGTTQEITSEDRLISMKKDAEGYYLKSTLRKITIVLTGTETNLLDQKITATVEVKTGANSWGSIPWGSFAITEANIDQDKGISTFTGYGGISALQGREYQSGVFTFPTTVGGLTRQLADYFGITINPEMKLLPDEYQRVTFIEGNNSGNTCIDTGWNPGLEFTIRMNASIQTTAQAGSRCYLFGTNTDDVEREADLVMSTSDSSEAVPSSGLRWVNNSGAGRNANVSGAANMPPVGSPFEVEVTSKVGRLEQKLTVGGTTTTASNSDWTGGWSYDKTLYLAALHHRNTAGYYNTNHNVRIFSAQIYDGDKLIRDYLPCRRKSDNKPGLYDLVEGKFYTNALTGEFTLGTDYDVTSENIPGKYQQVEYLESTGTQYIDTKYKFQQNDSVEIKVAPQSDGDKAIFGSYEDGGIGCELGTLNNQFRGNIGSAGTGYDYQKGETYTLELRSGKWYCGTVGFGNTKNTTATINSFLFARNYGNDRKTVSVKLYSASVKRNGSIIRNFIPCYRKADGKPGLYDGITGEFFTNLGTGEFKTGDPVIILPNTDAPIAEDLWANISGTTYRDVLEEIAGATGTIAVIGGGDDTLDFKKPPISEASETLTETNLITSKIGANWGKVSSVVLSRQPQNDNIVANDDETAALPTGKNLFSGWTIGKRVNPADGREQDNSSSAITDFMPVDFDENPTYYMSGMTTDLWMFTAGYNANKEFVGRTGAGARNGYQLDKTIFIGGSPTATGDIKYLRATIYQTSVTTGTIDMVASLQTQLEIGAQPTTYEEYIPNGLVPLTIANNQILDKQRETTAQPILDAVKGWEYRNAETKTEGHGYHEIGDRLDISVGGETYPTIVTKSTILVDGGISEILTSRTPEAIPINYAKSGGISKTVYRTELEVDKQEQRIDSIVSRQDATDAAVQEQFTQVTQNINSIVATAQASGGGNLIMNSVGFGKDSDGKLTVWQYGTGATTTTVRSQSSPASLNAGAVSGHEIMMTGASTISQTIALTPGEKYSLALRASKGSTGSVTVTLGNTSETATITLAAGTAYAWSQESVEFTPTIGANTLTITAAAGTVVEITDLILATGGAITWRQASGEIYNTQVSLDQGGVQVRSSVYTGDYVEITPLEFAGYSNAGGSMQKVFSLNRDTTEVEKLEARSQIKMPPIKIVPIDNASYEGWAFVKED